MLYFDRIDVSEGTDVNKSIALHECVACHYRYFLEINFRFQKVCNGCHDVFSIMISISLYDIAILNICGIDYCCIINEINKSEAINLL